MQPSSLAPADVTSPWRRPSRMNRNAVDVVEVARGEHRVLIRSSLGPPIRITPQAWADLVAAVKRGEYDDL
ncbi:DUF397 domain-containing protein [Frankia sp. CcI156]|uniref:DUF397 domain-containing protein n=1 Tax=Frankia casuarinae (strain DSM 45818 / CECT 9043 / HFP020203 / CcI3) TaxID=106370 RepID=Q2J8I7_FRACC|nr:MULTISPECIES: DUF397 domain-containing protein [Frankia]ABD12405.1 hypothetical protein Francci3_3048 [Frankia casuarinae]ETA01510.1 hypothetical protein CcI6DRAFT_03126 [Frankia sp. CcI6]EYT92016.1 hypothetical protein ThrDRAFT_02399 [Frankia casuarinae]KDA44773.1 hypothetical protein BMG523Draft_00295 [Frankia sp. BMG5.23]KEZ36621.1 protein of unknown function (DUF397) [Frankia sp. CeD]